MTTEKLAIDGGAPVRTKPFGARHFFGDPEKEQLMEVMDKDPTLWTSKYKTQEFEDGFAKRHGLKSAVATDSGTGSLHAAVAAINPEPGDEIITAPATDIGSVLGIILQNAIPIFSDWRPGGYFNQDAADMESRITERTRAIMVIHLYGYPVDMDAIMDVARRHDLPVIEDCSQAHLAEYKGKLVGTIGDMGCFSLARIHRRTSLGTALEEASGCSSESGIMVLEQKPARKQGAPNRCCHRTNPTVSASSLTTIAWWPMPACSCRPP